MKVDLDLLKVAMRVANEAEFTRQETIEFIESVIKAYGIYTKQIIAEPKPIPPEGTILVRQKDKTNEWDIFRVGGK